MAFTYLKVKSAKCYLFTSGGLGLGLKNLVLFTSLVMLTSMSEHRRTRTKKNKFSRTRAPNEF